MDYAKEALDEIWPELKSIGLVAITKEGNIATILSADDDFQPYAMVGALEELKIALLQEIEGLL
jgi:hypothetical protein